MHEGELDLHQKITTKFFDILWQHCLFLKLSKCTFKASEINFLGLQLTGQGITIAPDKISTIAEWLRMPQNLKELCKVLGVLGYQHPFIPNFAALAQPLTTLLKKNTEFKWTPNCARALNMLIKVICSRPVLVASD